MSDFGTMALVHRTDNSDVTDSDESALNAAIKQFQVVERDRIGPYVEFSFRIGGAHGQNGGQGFCVNFTEIAAARRSLLSFKASA